MAIFRGGGGMIFPVRFYFILFILLASPKKPKHSA